MSAQSTGSAAVGVPLTVSAVDLPVPLAVRLAQCGVRVGATVTVLARTAGGGRVLVAGSSRVAVDQASAAGIRVNSS